MWAVHLGNSDNHPGSEKWCASLSVYKNHLEGLCRHRISDVIGLWWGREFALLTTSQVIQVLLVEEIQIGNHVIDNSYFLLPNIVPFNSKDSSILPSVNTAQVQTLFPHRIFPSFDLLAAWKAMPLLYNWSLI